MAGRKKTEESTQGKKEGQEETLALEQSVERLEQVMQQLEEDDLSLEQSFALYKQGMDLLLACNRAIDKVEKELIVLETDGVDDGISEGA